MDRVISLLANLAGAAGLVLCVAAGLGRLAGAHDLAGLGPLNVLLAGTSLMVAACLGKLHLLAARTGDGAA